MTPRRTTGLPSPMATTGMVALALVLLAAASFLFAIWTRDMRWGQTAAVFAVPGAILSIIFGASKIPD